MTSKQSNKVYNEYFFELTRQEIYAMNNSNNSYGYAVGHSIGTFVYKTKLSTIPNSIDIIKSICDESSINYLNIVKSFKLNLSNDGAYLFKKSSSGMYSYTSSTKVILYVTNIRKV